MKDVTFRPETLREATARVRVRIDAPTRALIEAGGVSKGDVLEASRLAAIIAVKKTPDILPFCHPLPVGGIDARAALVADAVELTVTVRGIANTGFEMEALAGAAVGALNVYDMLKPHSTQVFMEGAELVEKRGGTADWRLAFEPALRAAMLRLEQAPGPSSEGVVRERLAGIQSVEIGPTLAIPSADLSGQVRAIAAAGAELIIVLASPGALVQAISTLREILDHELPGVYEAARSYGQRRSPMAMLQGGICGRLGETAVLTLPLDPSEADGICTALLPTLLRATRSTRA